MTCLTDEDLVLGPYNGVKTILKSNLDNTYRHGHNYMRYSNQIIMMAMFYSNNIKAPSLKVTVFFSAPKKRYVDGFNV